MIKKSIQYIDVTSMFNEEFQKQIYDKDAHHKKLPKNMSVINHVSLDNFKESVKYNSLFFKRFDAFRTGDEIPYEKYEGIYCKNVSDASERNRILNRNKNFKQLAYILPMYDDGDVTSYMHYKLYAAGYSNNKDKDKGSEDVKDKKEEKNSNKGVGLIVKYNFSRLIENIKNNAWADKQHPVGPDNIPIISLLESDRIFCGATYYLNSMDIGDIFDPANAVIPFFLKPAEDSSDKEYRLCVIRNSRYNSGTDSEDCKNVYIYIGNIFDSIESISFLSDCEKLVMQEIESELKKVKYKANTTVISDNFTEAVLTKDIEDVPDTTDRVRSFNVPKMTNTHTRKQRNSRLFSGKYDSMKQRYMLMRDNREYNYRCYNNSLRYEMLLCGKLTLTDSQFYDGMLFTEMIEHGHFVDFIKCSYKHDTLEIRRRCNQNEKKDFIKKIYGKSFYYSSIKSYELAKRIESAGEALWNHPEKEKYCETIDTYWDFMKSSLPVNSYNEEITNMKKWYAYFDSIYEDMFVPWGKLKDVTFDGNYYSFLTEDNAFCEAIEIANKLNSIPGADINRYTSFIIAKCRCSKSEFLDIKDFRTTIVEGQTQEIRARIKAVNIEDTQKEYANKLCNDLIKTFNYSYNRVIAMQHDCKFLDSISKDNGFEGHDHNDDITIKFDENSLNYISNCSWSEFEALLDDVYVDEARNNLYKLIDDIADEREIDVNCFTNALNNLNDAIRRYCEDCNIISGDKLNSIYNADAKTTDYFGTERFARQGGSKRFIGHGSNLVGSLSNDLCIFAPNTNDGEKMFRIYFDETPDNEYDTIICPTNYKEGK